MIRSAIAIILLIASPVLAEISVDGTGTVAVEPDMAVISLTIENENHIPLKATEECNKAAARVIDLAKHMQVREQDIRTMNYSVEPTYTYPQGKPKVLRGYRVRHSMLVAVWKTQDTKRSFAHLGILLNVLSGEPNVNINGVMFNVGHKKKFVEQARKLAVQDAMRKAEVLAATAHAEVGAVTEITELDRYTTAVKDYRANVLMKADRVPIAPGCQDVTVRVTMKFDLISDPFRPVSTPKEVFRYCDDSSQSQNSSGSKNHHHLPSLTASGGTGEDMKPWKCKWCELESDSVAEYIHDHTSYIGPEALPVVFTHREILCPVCAGYWKSCVDSNCNTGAHEFVEERKKQLKDG